jgi:3-hydroxyisobutyrate dehydrogenase-like beta-hydroxyacid dehydrogenase
VTESHAASRHGPDVVVVGGCGRAGLPLAVALADRGVTVRIYDIGAEAVGMVNAAQMPFAEPDIAAALKRVIAAGRLEATTDPAIVAGAEHVIVVIGPPSDEPLNPDHPAIPRVLDGCARYLTDGQLLIVRSAGHPDVTAQVEKMIAGLGIALDVAFCPEPATEDQAVTELYGRPRIVSSRSARGSQRASALFGRLTDEIILMAPEAAGPGQAEEAPAGMPRRQPRPAAGRRPPRWVATAAWAAAGLILFVCYWRLSQTVSVNSDGAGELLQAWDMLHGNLLLRGWTTGDVSLYTTQLPQYMLLELALGLHTYLFQVAGAMTYTLAVVLAALLAKGNATGRDGLIRAAIAAGIMLAPQLGDGVAIVIVAPDHLATALPVLVAWLILDRARPRWYVPVIIGAVLAWAQVADPLLVYIGVVPLLLVCAIRAYQGAVQGRQPWSSQWYELSLGAAALASVAAANLMAAALRAAGGFHLLPLIGGFADSAQLTSHMWLGVESVLVLFGADFFGLPLHPAPVTALFHLAGVFLVAWAVWLGARRFFRDRDLVPALLVVGLVINLAAFLLSTKVGDLGDAREIGPVLPFGAVLAGRLLSGRLAAARLIPVLLVMLLGYVVILGHEVIKPAVPVPNQQLANWLVARHLHNGLAAYWAADITTLLSEDRVQVVPVCGGAGGFAPEVWEDKASWYDPARHYANFLVIGAPSTCNYATVAQARSAFGPSARTYHVAGYTVLVWDKNLLAALR